MSAAMGPRDDSAVDSSTSAPLSFAVVAIASSSSSCEARARGPNEGSTAACSDAATSATRARFTGSPRGAGHIATQPARALL